MWHLWDATNTHVRSCYIFYNGTYGVLLWEGFIKYLMLSIPCSMKFCLATPLDMNTILLEFYCTSSFVKFATIIEHHKLHRTIFYDFTLWVRANSKIELVIKKLSFFRVKHCEPKSFRWSKWFHCLLS